MVRTAVIGAGISGLTTARLLKNSSEVTVFEKENRPGGLVKCDMVNGSLFHTCGGHVFNSKRQDVLEWFWRIFDRENEFVKADRNSVVFMENGTEIPYPIENHVYMMDKAMQTEFIDNILCINKLGRGGGGNPDNFEDFLKGRFGDTLYNLYFKPYNEKVWRRDLKNVPLTWLEGKLPMPTVEEMIFNNMNHIEEKNFVHSTFWYERSGGSQYIADKLSEDLNIVYNADVTKIEYTNGEWHVCGQVFDKVIFCGNIKDMTNMLTGVDFVSYKNSIDALEYHGTTAVFCEIDRNPYSWIYQPSRKHESHRIICTGNFNYSNNSTDLAESRITGTVEFTDYISKEDIIENLGKMPLHPTYITHKFNKYTYPIQNPDTRNIITKLKRYLSNYGFYFTGRFADWEYYNMDAAMGAAMDLVKKFHLA